jgi:hypothetical protein
MVPSELGVAPFDRAQFASVRARVRGERKAGRRCTTAPQWMISGGYALNRQCVSGVDLSNFGTCTIGRSVPELTRMMRGINHRGYRWAVDYLPKPRGRPRIAHPFVPRSGAPPSGSPHHTMTCGDVGGRVTDDADSPVAVGWSDRARAMAL